MLGWCGPAESLKSSEEAIPGSSRAGPPDVAQIGCVLLITAPVGQFLGGEPVAFIEPLRPHIRHERPQLKPARAPLLSQLEETSAEPVARPGRVDIQLSDPGAVLDHQAEQRTVISAREPNFLLVKDTAHPVPDLIVRMHQRRDLRNSMVASAQVHLGCDICVDTCAPSQP
jgi:hypothetical protein